MAYTPINPDLVYGFQTNSINVAVTPDSYSVPFNTIFGSTVLLLPSSTNITDTYYNDGAVNFTVANEGGSSQQTFTLSASTLPDFNFECIYETTTADTTDQICGIVGVDQIEYALVDGQDVEINDQGEVTWPTQSTQHKVLFKLKDGESGLYFFLENEKLVSVKVNLSLVGMQCFKGCTNLSEIEFCNGVENIYPNCASDCPNLYKVVFPKTLTYIGNYAFDNCPNLNEYYIQYTASHQVNFGITPFRNNSEDRYVYSYSDLQGTDTWTNISLGSEITYWEEDDEQLETDTTDIGDYTSYTARILNYNGVMQQNNPNVRLYSLLTIIQPNLVIYKEYNISTPIEVTLNKGTSEYIEYAIVNGAETIYQGKLYCPKNTITLRLNEIVESYINSQELTKSHTGIYKSTDYSLFEFYYTNDDGATTLTLGDGLLKIYNDWSYPATTAITMDTNYYIDNKVYDNVPIFLRYRLQKSRTATVSVIQINTDSSETVLATGTFSQTSVGVTLMPVTSDTVDHWKVVVVPTYGTSIEQNFYPTNADKRMTLYFRTKLGGWGTLYFNRTSQETDNYTIKNYITTSPTVNGNRTVQYKKNYTQQWKCNTDWITDSKSDLVNDAFASTECYIYEEKSGVLYGYDLIPVNITNTSSTLKKFFANGRKFNQYQFTIEAADEKKFI